MVQFIAIMVHAFQLLFIDCNYPKAFVWWIGMHAVMFLFLFNEFYKNAYSRSKVSSYVRFIHVCGLVLRTVELYFKEAICVLLILHM